MIIGENKRDHHRMSVDTEGEYRMKSSTSYTNCQIRDLSASGMLLLTDQPIAIGKSFFVRIVPSHSITPPLDAEIEAIRCEPGESGFEVACRIVEIH
jgi:hypothetical protein